MPFDDASPPISVAPFCGARPELLIRWPSESSFAIKPYTWARKRRGSVLKAGLAHLWFVTVHPFDDGNGRIARAIADMALARSEGSAQRFYSMSAQIREERDHYYRVLEQTQHGTSDITAWMEWFLNCLTRAIEGAQTELSSAIAKARYWDRLRQMPLNNRQRLVIIQLLEGFEGKMTTANWAALTKTSQDTALRDIQELLEFGVMVRDGAGGRSTSYSLAKV